MKNNYRTKNLLARPMYFCSLYQLLFLRTRLAMQSPTGKHKWTGNAGSTEEPPYGPKTLCSTFTEGSKISTGRTYPDVIERANWVLFRVQSRVTFVSPCLNPFLNENSTLRITWHDCTAVAGLMALALTKKLSIHPCQVAISQTLQVHCSHR